MNLGNNLKLVIIKFGNPVVKIDRHTCESNEINELEKLQSVWINFLQDKN